MVAPVISIPNKSLRNVNQYGICVEWQFGEHRTRQRAPFTINTEYSSQWGVCGQNTWVGEYIGSNPYAADTIPTRHYNEPAVIELLNRTFDKLKGKVYNSASAGLNFIEAHQAIDMIVRSATTIAGAYHDIKRLRFGDAAKKLRMHFVPKNVSVAKSAASNFLEYHFGWEPLVKDIYDALETYRDPIKTLDRESVKDVYSDVFHVVNNYTGDTVNPGWLQLIKVSRRIVVRQGCVFEGIADPLSFNLERWGVASPLSLAWEEVPFSFVVDWFANVGQVLQSGSAFAGLKLNRTFWSFVHETDAEGSNNWTHAPLSSAVPLSFYALGRYTYREPNLWQPVFQLKSLKYPSPVRGATAISLLVQQLRARK
ncbi:TPA_asm: maturation protein [ssRNA phage Zoerhiza.2_30]|uniref:Maturation protein n=2 Tax=Fiersviridae TaxID=2842319 RepID=A0A8S5KZ24_9VIRU|nr:maturation protein [ssRNA phage Zoerhiza.2_30]QDH87722.1 MAG: hypothetical protein H2Rhizo33874_000002 [Leviviridae sp.]DAD50423.1 TPA_asm: maturation protein [ssRNA phage Zoerhiza.2_30]